MKTTIAVLLVSAFGVISLTHMKLSRLTGIVDHDAVAVLQEAQEHK